MAGKKDPKFLRHFQFINDINVIETNGFDQIKGHGSLVLSTLQNDPDEIWTSRLVACAIERHPEFRTKLTTKTAHHCTPAERVVNFWIWKFKKFGLIKVIENAS